MKISDFDYNLPKDRIPDRPLANRGDSKMLVYRDGEVGHSDFSSIDSYFGEGDLLVLNNTRVIPARLQARKSTGGSAEILLITPLSHGMDYQLAMNASDNSEWKVIIGGKRIKPGSVLEIVSGDRLIRAEVISKDGMYGRILLEYGDHSLGEILADYGNIPLPPYMNREADEQDKEDYQTVFAKYDGSVAAPTASLHLTDSILDRIRDMGVGIEELTLHVGPGTFMPVSSDDPREHDMHTERIRIKQSTISELMGARERRGRIIASGTTAMRSLESLAALAYKVGGGDKELLNKLGRGETVEIEQFPFELAEMSELEGLIEAGLELLSDLEVVINADSRIMIMPGHPYFLSSGLITNFHLPKSTLLLLVGAFVGVDELWKIYKSALDSEYRFLSYGDGSLLLPRLGMKRQS